MSDAVAARTEHEVQILATMVDCAYRLSMALGEAPKAALLSSASAPPPRPAAFRGPNLARPPPRPPR